MATNKNATIRYQVLDKCFRNFNHRYFIDDLIKQCNEVLSQYNGIDGVSRRQIFDDIRFMESEAGWSIPLERLKEGKKVYYRYYNKDFSINKQPLTEEEALQLETAILTLNRFKGIPSNEWIDEVVSKLECKFNLKGNHQNIIGFQQNENLKGLHFLSTLIDAIANQQVLSIQYHNYKDGGKDFSYVIHPYYVKQYNNRWFLLGKDDHYGSINNIALDRILDIQVNSEIPYIPNTTLNFEHYFDNVIGVSIPRENPGVALIVAKIEKERFPYVTSKPIHASQQIVNEEERTIRIKVIPNRELDQQILSFGKDLEIISPLWYREHIAEIVKELYKKYNQCK